MRRMIALFVALLVSAPVVVLADKPDKAKDKKHHEKANVTIAVHERDVVRGYFVEVHGRGKCPPGLAKKDNGCLPPGQAKKAYVVGQVLAPTIVILEPPPELSRRLGPPPTGYRYGLVDGDLLKLAVGTALVVDAIGGLVD